MTPTYRYPSFFVNQQLAIANTEDVDGATDGSYTDAAQREVLTGTAFAVTTNYVSVTTPAVKRKGMLLRSTSTHDCRREVPSLTFPQ